MVDLDEDEVQNINDDTFRDDNEHDSTVNILNRVSREGGRVRSPSPAGSASSVEEIQRQNRTSPKSKRRKTGNSTSMSRIVMETMKETMKFCSRKKRKAEDSDSESDEDHNKPHMVDKQFHVKDNGHDILDYKVRNSLRTINAKPKRYFKHLAKKVEPALDCVEVDHLMADAVNPRVVKKLHNRAEKMELKYFDPDNLTVETKAPKTNFTARGGEVRVDTYLDWAEPNNVWKCVNAVLNYCTLSYSIRRDDYSPMVLIRTLHEIRFFAACKTPEKQRKVLTSFVNAFFRRNENNARKNEPPLDFTDSLKLAENELKKGNVGGNYYGIEPYGGSSGQELAEKEEELRKLRAKVAQLQRDLDTANRRFPATPNTATSYRKKEKSWGLMSGAEKVAITCRDW